MATWVPRIEQPGRRSNEVAIERKSGVAMKDLKHTRHHDEETDPQDELLTHCARFHAELDEWAKRLDALDAVGATNDNDATARAKSSWDAFHAELVAASRLRSTDQRGIAAKQQMVAALRGFGLMDDVDLGALAVSLQEDCAALATAPEAAGAADTVRSWLGSCSCWFSFRGFRARE